MRRSTSQCLIYHEAQAVLITQGGGWFAAYLLWCEVSEGCRGGRLPIAHSAAHVARNSKVGEIAITLVIEENVFRLQVSMHKALPVGSR